MRDVGELALLSPGHPVARPASRARLGRYELLVPIGSGGMAVAWVARLQAEAGFSKLVAIKTMLPHLVQVVEARRMLFDEARVAARILHPNVVAIHEHGEDHGVPYVVMEWVNGLSLDRLLTGGRPLDPGIAARIIADACAGLHAAHELADDAGRPLHVVHRDISPYNILVSVDGAVKVADFGIVKARGQLHHTTSGGNMRGRLAYMAPEQVLSAPVDRRSDVFAMGATLHEALTALPAFSGDNEAQLILKIAEVSYEPPSGMGGAEQELFAIVARALSRAPDDRFATAEEMRLALEAWLVKNAPPVITPSSIGAVVRERVGAELDQRQVQLRRALNASPQASTRPNALADAEGPASTAMADRKASGPDEHRLAGEALPPAAVSTSVAVATPPLPTRNTARWALASTAFIVLGLGLWEGRRHHAHARSPEPEAPAVSAAHLPVLAHEERQAPDDSIAASPPVPTLLPREPASAEGTADPSPANGDAGHAKRVGAPALPSAPRTGKPFAVSPGAAAPMAPSRNGGRNGAGSVDPEIPLNPY